MRFDHVGVLVADLQRGQAFARDVLGLGDPVATFAAPEHGLTGAFFAMGAGRLEILRFDEPGDRLPPGTGSRIDHIAVEVDDLDAEATRLRRHGVQFQGPLDPAPVATPVELRGRRHLWTRPETFGGVMLQLIEAPPA